MVTEILTTELPTAPRQEVTGGYALVCVSCGATFVAKQRNRMTCSERCRKRLQRGHRAAQTGTEVANYQTAGSGHDLPRQDGKDRLIYALYRGTLRHVDRLEVDVSGRVVGGPFVGRTLVEVLQTVEDRGWLCYKRRPDGWYSAEWVKGRGVTLCGPRSLPGPSPA